MMHRLLLAALGAVFAVALGVGWASAQSPTGITPCTGNPPGAIAVNTGSQNVQLSNCGPTLIVYNISAVEVFYVIGSASSTVATVSSNPLPGNTFVVLNVPGQPGSVPGWYFAVITATGTSSVQFVQGRAF